jgi:ribosomal protein S18 acetylase RimI-like enzyme
MLGQMDHLYRLRKDDVHRGATVLADAFHHDPIWSALMADAPLKLRQTAFAGPLRYYWKYGAAYAVSDRLEGIITLIPGELSDMTLWRLLRSGAMWSGMGLADAVRLGRKMGPVFSPVQVDRKQNMQGGPYLYLPMLGVAAEHQGQGVGGRLLRTLIAHCEQARLPLYLETETERNVRWYTSFGFEVIKQINLPVINLPMWEMVRRPQ